MAIGKNAHANLVGLKRTLYFFLICGLGFNLGFVYHKFIAPPIDGFVQGYVQCCYDIQHGEIQIIDEENAYIIPRIDSIIRIPIKINQHY